MTATKPSRDALAARDAERALALWRELDVAQSLHQADRDAVRASEAARSLVLELLARAGGARDLYNACARLGRLLADAGASPTLAVAAVDGAAEALAGIGIACDATLVAPARASVAEGYLAAVLEVERVLARQTWEYPACAVRLAKDTVALAAGYPADDTEALADWSARVALCVSRNGYKQAILAGPEQVSSELQQALALVGVERVTSVASKGWLSSLLRR